MAKPKPQTETDLLFDDAMRRALAIPIEEARAICDRTAPGKRRVVDGLSGKPPVKPPRRRRK